VDLQVIKVQIDMLSVFNLVSLLCKLDVYHDTADLSEIST